MIQEVQKDIEKSHKGGRGARQRAARRRRAEEMVAADTSDEVAEKVIGRGCGVLHDS